MEVYELNNYVFRLWLEETGRNYFFKIHSQNSVGIMKMEDIIRHNGWRLVL